MDSAIKTIVTTEKSVLKKAEGYWSKREILINPTDQIVLLKENATTKEAIEAIQAYIDSNVHGWVNDKVLSAMRSVKKGMTTNVGGFNLAGIPSLQKAEWMGQYHDTMSFYFIVKDLKGKGWNDEKIASFLADAWYKHYRQEPWSGLAHLSAV